ncbi:MAG: S4 domain-containing protein [Actinomycetota bacterium]
MNEVRIDKWLWAARFFKTRSAATDAVAGGRVHVGGARVKPSRDVKVGETVELSLGPVRRSVVVTALADRRGPASVAQTLYAETAESLAAREVAAAERKLSAPVFGARPTKVERRRLDALRRGQQRRG